MPRPLSTNREAPKLQFIYKPTVVLVGRSILVPAPEAITPGWEPEEQNDAHLLVELGGRGCYRSWKNPAGRSNR